MIAALLPQAVAVEEARGPLPGAALFPEEEAAVVRVVAKRREEYTTARACARRALARLGLPAGPIRRGARGEPQWPAGIVGSITHSEGYCACAVARAADVVTIGVDAEPNRPLPEGVLGAVAFGDEPALVRRLARTAPHICWDRLLFSAKESVYKAWFPLAGAWLGFEDARLTFDVAARTFAARLLIPGPLAAGGELRMLTGRWGVAGGLVLTAVALGECPTLARAAPGGVWC